MVENDKAVYLFCFAGANLLQDFKGTGIDGESPIFLHGYKDIAALVCMVPLRDFTGEAAEANMQDLSWIVPRAVRHEEVVEEVLRLSPVFPARFGTLFLSPASIMEFMVRHYSTIADFLEGIRGREEWAVKVFLDREESRKTFMVNTLASWNDRPSPSPGARYLRERKLRASVENDLMEWVKGISSGLWSNLQGLSENSAERKVLPEAGEEGEEMVLNWAFLVAKENLERFRAVIDKANSEYACSGLRFESSGPWPPYSFTPALSDERMP